MANKITLYETDYVLVDKKTKKSIEDYNYIYHYSSIIEEYNDRVLSENGMEFIKMTELPYDEWLKYKERKENE